MLQKKKKKNASRRGIYGIEKCKSGKENSREQETGNRKPEYWKVDGGALCIYMYWNIGREKAAQKKAAQKKAYPVDGRDHRLIYKF